MDTRATDITINRCVIEDFLDRRPNLKNFDLEDMWFQEDVICHTTRANLTLLQEQFFGRTKEDLTKIVRCTPLLGGGKQLSI